MTRSSVESGYFKKFTCNKRIQWIAQSVACFVVRCAYTTKQATLWATTDAGDIKLDYVADQLLITK